MAAALILGPLVLGCHAAGGGGTHVAGQLPQATATATAGTAAKTPVANQVPPGPGPFTSDATDRKLATALAASIQRAFTPPPGSSRTSMSPRSSPRRS